MEPIVETEVWGCARCGLDHAQIAWRAFARPVAPAETYGDPILLRRASDL